MEQRFPHLDEGQEADQRREDARERRSERRVLAGAALMFIVGLAFVGWLALTGG